MEKLIYLVWKPEHQSNEIFCNSLVIQTSKQLGAAGAKSIRITLADNDVAPAHKSRIISARLAALPSAPDAMVSFWLNSAIHRKPVESILRNNGNIISGYLVTESEPLVNTKHPAQRGQRAYGMNQVVFLRKPERLTREQWLELWLGQHTPIAMATQSTFGYRQNIVAHVLTENALSIDAIVEENFPPEAMNSAHAFYNATGDDQLMKKNQSAMFASVQRFIDLDKLDCLPMSEYNF